MSLVSQMTAALLEIAADISALKPEIGLFDPYVYGIDSAGGATYTQQEGVYTRIGDRVFFDIRLSWTGHSGTGYMRVGGLPYSGAEYSIMSAYISNLAVGSGKLFSAYFDPSSNAIVPVKEDPSGATITTGINVDVAASIFLSGNYKVSP